MAKSNDKSQPQRSRLVVSREKLKQTLSERIAAATPLLAFNVPTQTQSYGYGYGRSRIVYDETKKEEFFNEFHKWTAFNREVLKQSFDNPDNEYLRDYENSTPLPFISTDTDIVAEQKDDIKKLVAFMEGLIDRIDLIPIAEGVINTPEEKEKSPVSTKVFIVHGHNEEVKQSVARMLVQVGLQPVILHEQVNAGMTIIEKFQEKSDEISFAVILLTHDDMGISIRQYQTGVNSGESLKPRARQNVVFEMGYFIGKLGRSKVFILLQDGVEVPGDISGLVYTPYDSGGAWKFQLVKELKNAGYKVSADMLL